VQPTQHGGGPYVFYASLSQQGPACTPRGLEFPPSCVSTLPAGTSHETAQNRSASRWSSQQLAETAAAASPEQMKHNKIISNPVFVSAISAMQGPDLDIDTLWWMVQWGNEYLARFKRDGTKAQKTAHAAYKSWTSATKQKQMAGFSASLRSRAGDDSFDQSLE
jgi:hypothetical protein